MEVSARVDHQNKRMTRPLLAACIVPPIIFVAMHVSCVGSPELVLPCHIRQDQTKLSLGKPDILDTGFFSEEIVDTSFLKEEDAMHLDFALEWMICAVLPIELMILVGMSPSGAAIRIKIVNLVQVILAAFTLGLRKTVQSIQKCARVDDVEDVVLSFLSQPFPRQPSLLPPCEEEPVNQTGAAVNQTTAKYRSNPSHEIEAMLVTASPRFWNDRSGHRRKLHSLPSREIEMRALNRLLGGSQFHTVPAAEWPIDVGMALDRATPRVLILSGHWHGSNWAAENDLREAHLVSGAEFGEMLEDRLPEILIFNGCMSHEFAHSAIKSLQASRRSHDVFMVCDVSKFRLTERARCAVLPSSMINLPHDSALTCVNESSQTPRTPSLLSLCQRPLRVSVTCFEEMVPLSGWGTLRRSCINHPRQNPPMRTTIHALVVIHQFMECSPCFSYLGPLWKLLSHAVADATHDWGGAGLHEERKLRQC